MIIRRYLSGMGMILKMMDSVLAMIDAPSPQPVKQRGWLAEITFNWLILCCILAIALMVFVGIGLTIYAGNAGIIGLDPEHRYPVGGIIYCLCFAGVPALLFLVTIAANLWRYRSLPHGYVGEQLSLW